MSKKTIIIKPSLLATRKTVKNKVSSILDSIDTDPMPDDLKPEVKPEVRPEVKDAEPSYGCLKNGKKPTLRSFKQTRCMPRVVAVATFGKTKGKTVSVRVNDIKTIKSIEREKKKLHNQPLTDVVSYTNEHNLTRVGSTAPEHIVRTIFESARLTGEIINDNSESLLHNFNAK
jgi:hypothetical protein